MKAFIPAFLIGLACGPMLAQDTTDPSVFGNWQVVCGEEAECRMAQTIVQPGSSRVVLQGRVFKSDPPTLLLTFPLGILLSTGWSYQIDGGLLTTVPFEICNPSGCHAAINLDADLLKRLKKGSELKILFRDADNEPVVPMFSLTGFTKAYEALQ